MRKTVVVVAVFVSLAVLLLPAGGTAPGKAETPFPDSIAAIGDSITQAANASLLHFGPSFPHNSWATGDDPYDTISSHYERLLAHNPAIAGRQANHAVSGAKMADANRQAALAVQQGAAYVTVLLGANDVCAPSKEAMTPVADFESSFRRAMTTVTTGLPAGRIYVASIPDIYQLWALNQGDLLARLTWEWFRICPTMLAGTNTEADRQYARARNADYNAALRRVCAEFSQCRFDDNRVFDARIEPADVSLVDHFHPSIEGLRKLAELTWRSGYWPDA